MQKTIIMLCLAAMTSAAFAQTASRTMLRLPDTGQNMGYTATFGEDNDYNINPPHFYNNSNGTVSDTVTGLMWQRTDGGEMTVENAAMYADTLTLGGFTDWRLPTAHEAFVLLNHQNNNPALNTTFFVNTGAGYWWTSERQVNDAAKAWCTNAGGGVGNHPKSETISAGGVKKFHARAVRQAHTATVLTARFTDNNDGTMTDNTTDLVWQKTPNTATLTWEEALAYAENLTFAAASDWRLPNIKELQSLTDVALLNPCISTTAFPTIGIKKYWSSSSLSNQTTQAWYLSTVFGITTYDLKTVANYAICVKTKAQTVATTAEKANNTPTFRVFPNPTNGSICIYFDEKTAVSRQVIFTNSIGQVITNDAVAASEKQHIIASAGLPSGIYYVTVQSGGAVKTVKIIVFF